MAVIRGYWKNATPRFDSGRLHVRIIEKRILDLTPVELKQCRNLSLRKRGLMCEELSYWRNWESKPNRMRRKCRVIMIKYDDSERLVAWAFVFPRYERGYEVYFYTRVRERNKGYGSILMEQARAIDPRPKVCPHDYTSGKFFAKHRRNIRFDKWDARWVA